MNAAFKLMCCVAFCCASAVADSRQAAERAVAATVEIEATSKEEVRHDNLAAIAEAPFRSDDESNDVVTAESVTKTLVSGTIVSPEGLIATNELGSQSPDADLTVRLSDGTSLSGKVVLDDRRSRLQLVKVDAVDLPAISISEHDVTVGQSVVSVATLDGYRGAVIDGIVSGVNRVRWEQWRAPLIQTSLPTGAGSGGSPVVDLSGDLVGIVAAAAGGGPEQQAAGAAFAVPAIMVSEAIDAVKDDEFVTIRRGYLGVTCRPDTARATLRTVNPGSPADVGGLKPGDEWVSVGGASVNSVDDFVGQIVRHPGGSTVELVVKRGDKLITTSATLESKSSDIRAASRSRLNVSVVSPSKLGVLSLGVPGANGTLTPEAIEALQNLRKRLFDQKVSFKAVTPPSPPVIRVERSNVEEKLDQLSESIRELQEQVSRLADVVGKQPAAEESE